MASKQRRTKLVLKEAYNFLYTSKKPEYKDYMNKQVLNEIDYFLKLYNLVPKFILHMIGGIWSR